MEPYKVAYLGDGDSKGLAAVEGLGIYGEQDITKLECVGHVQKRKGTRLRKLNKNITAKTFG